MKERERNLAGRRERQLRYWHKTDGGYVRRRRRHLHAERVEVLRLLHEIEQEGPSC